MLSPECRNGQEGEGADFGVKEEHGSLKTDDAEGTKNKTQKETTAKFRLTSTVTRVVPAMNNMSR